MQLSLEKNQTGMYEITPLSGRFAGRKVAMAEVVAIRSGTERACSIKSVWGLTVLTDRVHQDAETIQSLLGLRR